MTPEINEILTILEVTLINEERPDYCEVSYQNGAIYILSSKREYKNYNMYERIQGISSLLQFMHSDILELYHVIIECFDDKELDEVFKLYRGCK